MTDGPEPGGSPQAARGDPQRKDPWAHRRGEPRVFAFMWTLYLLGATVLTLVSLGLRDATTRESYRLSATLLIVVVMVGVAWLWPMTRLAQSRPRGRASTAFLVDALIVLGPAQAIILPQWVLCGWSLRVTGGIMGLSMGWGVMVAGVLATALADRDGAGPSVRSRAVWMAVLVAASLVGPFFGVVANGLGSRGDGVGPAAQPVFLLSSPFTGVVESIRRGEAGEPVAGPLLVTGLVTGVAGVALLGVSRARGD